MKKNVLIKGILVLVVISLLAIGFTGCTLIFSTTGTVHINITSDYWKYYIYLDNYSNLIGITEYDGRTIIYDVPTGWHTFYAVSIDGFCSGQKDKWIHSGFDNYVDIDVDCTYY